MKVTLDLTTHDFAVIYAALSQAVAHDPAYAADYERVLRRIAGKTVLAVLVDERGLHPVPMEDEDR